MKTSDVLLVGVVVLVVGAGAFLFLRNNRTTTYPSQPLTPPALPPSNGGTQASYAPSPSGGGFDYAKAAQDVSKALDAASKAYNTVNKFIDNFAGTV